MAGAYVAETLQWRGSCLGYMNSWFGARRTFEKLGVEAENDRSIGPAYPSQFRRTLDVLSSTPSRVYLVPSQTSEKNRDTYGKHCQGAHGASCVRRLRVSRD
jgi:hypothetical protein